MLVALEQARSMALFAAVTAANGDAVERRRALAAAKVQIGRSGRPVGQEAIQLHGGIGMTMEHKVGHYFKLMTKIDKMLSDAYDKIETLARLCGLFGNTKAAAIAQLSKPSVLIFQPISTGAPIRYGRA